MYNDSFLLKIEILGLVLAEVQGLGFYWNPFAGVIAKTHAVVIGVSNSFFAAEDLPIFKLHTVGAVAAGTLYFFAKEHTESSFVALPALYYSFAWNATAIFYFYRKNKDSCYN